MKNYSVKYKTPNMWFFKEIKNLKGDWVDSSLPVPMRVFQTEKEERIEVPMLGTVFKFSESRHFFILKNMEKEAGQKIAVG